MKKRFLFLALGIVALGVFSILIFKNSASRSVLGAENLEPTYQLTQAAKEKRLAEHLEKYGHLFADQPYLSEEDVKRLAMVDAHSSAEANEQLMYAYWNNNMGVPVDLSKARFHALRAEDLGSNRGKIASAILSYFDKDDPNGKNRSAFYLSQLDDKNKTDKNLYELYKDDPFVKLIDKDFKEIFEAYKKSIYYVKR